MTRALSIAVVVVVAGVGVFADCVASDRPLLLRLDGELYVAPNLIDYQDLRGLRGDALSEQMDADDWALWPPVRHSPVAVRTGGELRVVAAPDSDHWLGTDDRGRDVLARLVHGARATVAVAAGSAVLALAIGALLGLLAAWRRGAVDAVVVGSCDVVSAVPALVVIVAAQGLLGDATLASTVVLIALPRIADTARIARASVTSALAEPYCVAARALGATSWRVAWRHALPAARSQLAVATAITASTAVLAEAALGFLGFGLPAPTASWGEILEQAHHNDLPWWLVLPAGAAITMVAAAIGALAHSRRSPDCV